MLDASGNTTISGNATIGGNAVVTGTLQANGVTGSVYPLVLGTAVASTSGTAIDFTGIPSWVRRITVMLNGVSTNGSSIPLIQIGSGSVVATGYNSQASSGGTGLGVITTGFAGWNAIAATVVSGNFTLFSFGSNTWSGSGMFAQTNGTGAVSLTGGISPVLSGALDRVRITTVGGTDVFDAGSINILYE